MQEKKFDLEDRCVKYAGDNCPLTYQFPKTNAGNYYGNQLLRSTGSSALNFGEAIGATTAKDKMFKFGLVLKELRETKMNLRIVKYIKIGEAKVVTTLMNETEELIAITTSIRNKLKDK